MAYATIDDIKMLGSMPHGDVDRVEANNPGVVAGLCTHITDIFDSMLRKRYAVPFAANDVPPVVRFHVTQVVCYQLWLKLGYHPGSEQDDAIEKSRNDALGWLREAADAETGFVELPRRQTPPDESGVVKGGPYASSEVSPYTWMHNQRDAVRGGSR